MVMMDFQVWFPNLSSLRKDERNMLYFTTYKCTRRHDGRYKKRTEYKVTWNIQKSEVYFRTHSQMDQAWHVENCHLKSQILPQKIEKFARFCHKKIDKFCKLSVLIGPEYYIGQIVTQMHIRKKKMIKNINPKTRVPKPANYL